MAVAFPGAGDADSEFESWLASKLKSFNMDDSVLVTYVKGILESEEEDDGEKTEALLGILSELSAAHVEEFCQEILRKWSSLKSSEGVNGDSKSAEIENHHETHLEDRIAQIMHEQAENAVKKTTNDSKQDARVKQAILAQYSEVADIATDDEAEESEDGEGGAAALVPAGAAASAKPNQHPHHGHEKDKEKEKVSSTNLLVRNTNAELVAKAEKQKREQAKAEAEKKKQLDKVNREKQKQAAQERKDKEKQRTQKGERRR